MHVVIAIAFYLVMLFLLSETIKMTTHLKLPSFKDWDYYDVNLEDDGVLGNVLAEGTPVNEFTSSDGRFSAQEGE